MRYNLIVLIDYKDSLNLNSAIGWILNTSKFYQGRIIEKNTIEFFYDNYYALKIDFKNLSKLSLPLVFSPLINKGGIYEILSINL